MIRTSSSGPVSVVSTGMGNRIRVKFPGRDTYFGMLPATKVNSAWPSLVDRRIEYQPKGGCLAAGSTCRQCMVRVWVAGKPV